MGLQPISFPSVLFPSSWLFGHSHCFLPPKLNWWINCLTLTAWATTAKPIVRLRQVKMHWFFSFFFFLCSLIFICIWGPYFVRGTLCSVLSVSTRNTVATGQTQPLAQVSSAFVAPNTKHNLVDLCWVLSCIRWVGSHRRLHSQMFRNEK